MKILIVLSAILIFGLIGGLINAIRTNISKKNYWKSLVKGVGAALLVPIFLEIIKSDIGRSLDENFYDYIVFGGFCLVTAIFSDKFIDTIGDNVLQSAKNAEAIAKESNEKADIIINLNSDSQKSEIKEKIQTLNVTKGYEVPSSVEKILESLDSPKYKFRSREGIAKDTGYSISKVTQTLQFLSEMNMVNSVKSNKGILWTLNN